MGDIRETRVRSLLSHLSMLCIYFIFYKAVSGLFHHLQLLFTAGHASTTTPLACFGLSSFLLYIHRTTRKKKSQRKVSQYLKQLHTFSRLRHAELIHLLMDSWNLFLYIFLKKEKKSLSVPSKDLQCHTMQYVFRDLLRKTFRTYYLH